MGHSLTEQDDEFRWDAAALAQESLDCVSGRHTALYKDDRSNELLRAIALAQLACYESWREFTVAVRDTLREAKEQKP